MAPPGVLSALEELHVPLEVMSTVSGGSTIGVFCARCGTPAQFLDAIVQYRHPTGLRAGFEPNRDERSRRALPLWYDPRMRACAAVSLVAAPGPQVISLRSPPGAPGV